MPIHAKTNLYPGVNPHLNSWLQNQTGWKGFHNSYANSLLRHLTANLPGGYFAVNEQSLQISTVDDGFEFTVPDSTIYSSRPESGLVISAPNPAPTLTVSVAATIPDEEYVASVVIYEGAELPGKPIIRIEILSPANKPPGSHFEAYRSKRSRVLQAGLRLIEIDLLHEQRPVVAPVWSYRDRQHDATPYTILVNDPRPDTQQGKTYIYSIGILDELPEITLPLTEDNTVQIDFNWIYNDAFTSSGLYAMQVDYTHEPENFAAYTEADQEKIRAHMAKINSDSR